MSYRRSYVLLFASAARRMARNFSARPGTSSPPHRLQLDLPYSLKPRLEIRGHELDVANVRVIELLVMADDAFSARDDGAAQQRRRVVQNHDVGVGTFVARQRRREQKTLFEARLLIRKTRAVEQHADVEIAVAVRAPIGH